MIFTYPQLLERYKEYANPKTKIAREVKNGNLTLLKRGIYEDDKKVNKLLLASLIYGPSYISFETALKFYSLIPESVYEVTSATCGKRKHKEFNNYFGRFTYKDLPSEVYSLGIDKIYYGDNYWLVIATKEKALLDMLYAKPAIYSVKDLKVMLFLDLRINEELFDELDKNKMIEMAKHYKKSTHRLLIKYLENKNV